MRRRHKLSRRVSRKHFRRNSGFHPRNLQAVPMRGGFRI